MLAYFKKRLRLEIGALVVVAILASVFSGGLSPYLYAAAIQGDNDGYYRMAIVIQVLLYVGVFYIWYLVDSVARKIDRTILMTAGVILLPLAGLLVYFFKEHGIKTGSISALSVIFLLAIMQFAESFGGWLVIG